MGPLPPYPPVYRGFFGRYTPIIPSKKFQKKIYKKGPPYINFVVKVKNKFLEIF
jgi:hypothetical protein